MFFSPFSIAITSLGDESTFGTFVLLALVWFCLFPHPHGVWEGLQLMMVTLPGPFSYFFLNNDGTSTNSNSFSSP